MQTSLQISDQVHYKAVINISTNNKEEQVLGSVSPHLHINDRLEMRESPGQNGGACALQSKRSVHFTTSEVRDTCYCHMTIDIAFL